MAKQPSRASLIRSGMDLSPEDMEQLTKALATPEGQAEYQRWVRLADRTSDMAKKDAYIWNSLNFWRDEVFKDGKNAYAAAQRKFDRQTSDVARNADGEEFSVYDTNPSGAVHATSLASADHDDRKVRTGRISDLTGARETRGQYAQDTGNTDIALNLEREQLLKTLIDAAEKGGVLINFMIVLAHWKLNVPSFVRLSRNQMEAWKKVQAARDAVPEKQRNNVRNVAKELGFKTFTMQRELPRITKALTKGTGLSQDELVDLLAP